MSRLRSLNLIIKCYLRFQCRERRDSCWSDVCWPGLWRRRYRWWRWTLGCCCYCCCCCWHCWKDGWSESLWGWCASQCCLAKTRDCRTFQKTRWLWSGLEWWKAIRNIGSETISGFPERTVPFCLKLYFEVLLFGTSCLNWAPSTYIYCFFISAIFLMHVMTCFLAFLIFWHVTKRVKMLIFVPIGRQWHQITPDNVPFKISFCW